MPAENVKHVHIKYNKRLKKIVAASSLVECAVPVFVCDENLYTCMVSKGARKQPFTVSVGKNLSAYLSDDVKERLSQPCPQTILAEFSRGDTLSNVIIATGSVQGERYTAIIFEPQLMFYKTPAPWYVNEAFETVRASVDELISSSRVCVVRLEWYCSMLSRLCSFHVKLYENGPYPINYTPELYYDIDLMINECDDIIKAIGGRIVYSKEMYKPLVTNMNPRALYMATAMLVTVLVLISSDGTVNVNCSYDEAHKDYLEISHSVIPDRTVEMPVDTISELLKCLPHLRLDIAALLDMMRHLKCPLDCRSDSRGLTVTYRIPAVVAGEIRFMNHDTDYITELRPYLDRLCKNIPDYFENNK